MAMLRRSLAVPSGRGKVNADPRHLAGAINGGGHNVSVQVGEGEISIV
jgi:hypothetical protein